MKHIQYWILGIAVSPFILFLILTALLYCPPVQKWAVDKAVFYASEKTGMNIDIQEVRLRFPLDLELGGISVIAQNDSLPQQHDTIFIAQRATCNVQLRPLLSKNVEVDILQFDKVQLNTTNFISDCRVSGKVGQMMLVSHGINLNTENVNLNKVLLADANLDVQLADTAKEDTTKTELYWKIALEELNVQRTKVLVHMPGDTINIGADINSLACKDGYFDLYSKAYIIRTLDANASKIKYDNRFATKLKGLDYNHISINDLNLGTDSINMNMPDICAKIRACNFTEKSGIAVTDIHGNICIDSTSVHVPQITLRTPYSNITAGIDMDFTAFDAKAPGKLKAKLDASLGRKDIMFFAYDALPRSISKQWPDKPMTIIGNFEGNMKKAVLDNVSIALPHFFNLKSSGVVTNLDNPDLLKLNMKLNAHLLGNMSGDIKGNLSFAAKGMQYNGNISADRLNINRMLPGVNLGAFSGDIKINGRGTDIFSSRTTIDAQARIRSFRYDRWNLDGATASCKLNHGVLDAKIDTHSQILNGNIAVNALMKRGAVQATLGADIANIDLYALRFVKKPLSIGICAHVDVGTDMKDYYKLIGNISDLRITDSAHVYRPDDMEINMLTRRDTTHAVVDCGDFHLDADARGGYKALMATTGRLSSEINRQIADRVIDNTALRNILPLSRIKLSSGQNNPIARLSKFFDCNFSYVDLDVTTSPLMGINGQLDVDTLITSSIQLDKIRLSFDSDEQSLNYLCLVNNGDDNPMYPFDARIKGNLRDAKTSLTIDVDDHKNGKLLGLGIDAMMEPEGIKMQLGNSATLGYRMFSVNSDNQVFLRRDMHVFADVKMKASDGTGLQIYSNNDDGDALQDLTLSMYQLDLANILKFIPNMPDVRGVMNGDFHLLVNEENFSVSSDVDIRNLIYENCGMGNISSEFVYMPLEDGSHHINGILMKDGTEVATLIGAYNPLYGGTVDANVELLKTPLELINGFIPDQIIGFKGFAEGELSLNGPLSKIDINGQMNISGGYLLSIPYGVSMRIDDHPVTVTNSRLHIENFKLHSANENPLVCAGDIDFADTEHIFVNLGINGKNCQVINAKENRRSEAYGNAFVNLAMKMRGELNMIRVNGNIEVLPSTNLYYILRDSPLTTDNRMKELVTFTDFRQDSPAMTIRPTVDGVDVDIKVKVDDGSHIVCWLNTNHSNHLDIYGNGDLRMKYSNQGITMTGRYTISSGEMKYSLPIIPLKTFTISGDSFIEFTGDVMNPKLNITATEENHASVTTDGESRSVNFDCGVKITKTLNDMGLEFIISARDDKEIDEQLSMMSIEERAKVAVTMLTTGMYFTDNNTNSFTMNSALSAFIQSEINNIVGSALKTLDLQIGLENNIHADGSMRTDYSFKFAKRFWNNRLSVAVGGKISTGSETENDQSIFDNVELQYRMSDKSNQYARLFYKHNVYDNLEGYVDQYGGAYMWKRKFQSYKDLLPKKNSEKNIVEDGADTINTSKEGGSNE